MSLKLVDKVLRLESCRPLASICFIFSVDGRMIKPDRQIILYALSDVLWSCMAKIIVSVSNLRPSGGLNIRRNCDRRKVKCQARALQSSCRAGLLRTQEFLGLCTHRRLPSQLCT